jgi:metallo-beta-lactamase class B
VGRKTFISLLVVLFCLSMGFTMTAMAQDTAKIWLRQGPHKLLDSDEIKVQMNKARELAGKDYNYLRMQRLQCADPDDNGTIDQTPGSNTLPKNDRNPTGWKEVPAVPTKVFDNVYYVGGMEVGGWIIDTGKGYIMLDASYDYGYEEILLPNMKKLGLDPAKVKYILITHSGPDHVGAAKAFQDAYGTKVVYNSTIKANPAWLKQPPVTTVMNDGDTLTLGDTTITMVLTPRNVGGDGFSYLIPVKIKGKRHMWATFGNTGIPDARADKDVYRQSMAKFLTHVDKLGADIAISSHPFVDASLNRMKLIRECNDRQGRQNLCGSHNPFLIGKKAARRYFEIMDQCAVIQTMRQEAGLDNTGLKLLPSKP